MVLSEKKEMFDKVLNVIGHHTDHEEHGYCDTGEDMGFSCRSECVHMAISRLKYAFLNGDL